MKQNISIITLIIILFGYFIALSACESDDRSYSEEVCNNTKGNKPCKSISGFYSGRFYDFTGIEGSYSDDLKFYVHFTDQLAVEGDESQGFYMEILNPVSPDTIYEAQYRWRTDKDTFYLKITGIHHIQDETLQLVEARSVLKPYYFYLQPQTDGEGNVITDELGEPILDESLIQFYEDSSRRTVVENTMLVEEEGMTAFPILPKDRYTQIVLRVYPETILEDYINKPYAYPLKRDDIVGNILFSFFPGLYDYSRISFALARVADADYTELTLYLHSDSFFQTYPIEDSTDYTYVEYSPDESISPESVFVYILNDDGDITYFPNLLNFNENKIPQDIIYGGSALADKSGNYITCDFYNSLYNITEECRQDSYKTLDGISYWPSYYPEATYIIQRDSVNDIITSPLDSRGPLPVNTKWYWLFFKKSL